MYTSKILDRLYTLSGYLSAFFLALIAILTLAQILGRQFSMAIETSELSGFCLAASSFFGLAYTLVKGEHVRVGLFEGIKSAPLRNGIELWTCIIGAAVTMFATWNLFLFARDSFTYGDLSPGIMAVPMWIPQGTLVIGLGLMALAFVHQAVLLLLGKRPLYLEKTGMLED